MDRWVEVGAGLDAAALEHATHFVTAGAEFAFEDAHAEVLVRGDVALRDALQADTAQARQSRGVEADQALAFRVDELVLEWANREMAELDVASDIAAAGRHLSAGVVDVKSYYLESADEVAQRIERVLEAGVPEAGLSLVPDCGFSQTARWATKPKLRALVEGRDLVLGRGSAGRPTVNRNPGRTVDHP